MKNAVVSARIDEDTKKKAEEILNQLGIPVSVLINSLYRQIIYRHGVPFSITLPEEPESLEEMSKEELKAKLAHSYQQALKGQGVPFEEAFDLLKKDPEK